MYPQERRAKLLEQVRATGRASVAEEAERLGVNAETIRRDFVYLDTRGLVVKVHGGALSVELSEEFEHPTATRQHSHAKEKRRIGEAAAALVGPRDAIIVDAGTTTGQLLASLPPSFAGLIITNAPAHAVTASSFVEARVQMLGGRIRPLTGACVGSDTVAALKRLHADFVFLGANGIHVEHGATTPDPDECAAKEAMAQAGDNVVVLADSHKINKTTTCRFAGIEEINTLITDSRLGSMDIVPFQGRGITVELA